MNDEDKKHKQRRKIRFVQEVKILIKKYNDIPDGVLINLFEIEVNKRIK